ncbi:glycosyltransferase family 4 protein [Neobacillus vireti]|uniref:glycosyltransferase family 4 protein n=1 Tax=Neobacillus vireti TaxID=220686 RepID=UPI002FFF4FCE
MKKILIVNSFYYPDIKGGAEVSTQLLAEGLSKHFDVYVLTSGGQKRDILKEEVNGVKVYRIPCNNLYWPRNSIQRSNMSKLLWHFLNQYNPIQNSLLKKVLGEISPNLIHTQNLMGIGTCLWDIAKKLNIPVVHTLRDYALMEPVAIDKINKFFSISNVQRSKSVDHVVGISNFILNRHFQSGLFPYSSHNSIHNVVSAQKYPRRYRQNGEPLIIGYYGQLERNKGISILIKAIKAVPDTIVGQVIICGVGSQESKLKTIIENDQRFVFKGKLPIQEVYQTMAATDLTIVPSVWDEPFGRVIIESYMQGTPVIASNTGGITEVIISKEYTFKNKEFKELQEKIINFSKMDQNKVIKEIDNAYEHAKKYSENISNYISVYESVLPKK